MIVRTAQREDLLGIGRVADAAHWASYDGLLRPDTIGQLITRDFGPSTLARRLLRGGMRVVSAGDDILGFVDGVEVGDAVHVSAIAVDPSARRHGVGTALLTSVWGLHRAYPISADVLLGNLEGEGFYEANGFVPGEVVHGRLFDEDVVERRWWREAESMERELGNRAVGG